MHKVSPTTRKGQHISYIERKTCSKQIEMFVQMLHIELSLVHLLMCNKCAASSMRLKRGLDEVEGRIKEELSPV